MTPTKPFAVVTGASSGIGLELAKLCAANGHDLLIAADQTLDDAAEQVKREGGAKVETLQADLSTTDGVDSLIQAIGGRPVAALLANAGHGLGRAFIEQDWPDIRHVIDTNVTGTVYLLHKMAPVMKQAGQGRILITGSIAGFMPGTFQAVYNGSKAFIDSFSHALMRPVRGRAERLRFMRLWPVLSGSRL